MIVIMTYYSDGSETPELRFVLEPDALEKVVQILGESYKLGKEVVAYEIFSSKESPVLLTEGIANDTN